jgi:DUF1680 family protein
MADPMHELSLRQVEITDGFWLPRLDVNARQAIYHQWQQLEASHCIDNFRIAAGEKQGLREGWFFSDSDAYKWLDAAASIYVNWPSGRLKNMMDDFIDLLTRAQVDDGYLFTYNQIHFPNEPRWQNNLIEHELYCHGHLIEAGAAHFRATGQKSALIIAIRAADMLVEEFLVNPSSKTSGHEEIEIAMLHLFEQTGRGHYLELARQFLERRGKLHPFFLSVLLQNASVNNRKQAVQKLKEKFLIENPEYASFKLPSDNYSRSSPVMKLRWQFNAITGKYFQMHAPIRKQTIPVGHSVRFAYLETATAMLFRYDRDQTLLPTLRKAWDRMVSRRMYITGGIGSLPELEGFGRDYELDPELAYAETCAALGSMFWNWEMTLITAEACYADLLEWQLYNAAMVGMGISGEEYLYNNPLLCKGGITRRPWFLVPCCPSNLSRTLASLGKYVYSTRNSEIWVHQYISSVTSLDPETPVIITMDSGLPWDGRIKMTFTVKHHTDLLVWLRIPSWAENYSLHLNAVELDHSVVLDKKPKGTFIAGYDPCSSRYVPIKRVWNDGDVLEINFTMPIMLRHPDPHIMSCQGKASITRGPLVYCLESVDNPGVDIFAETLVPTNLRFHYSPTLLGGTGIIMGRSASGKSLSFIPYQLWANRGVSRMNVWVTTDS